MKVSIDVSIKADCELSLEEIGDFQDEIVDEVIRQLAERVGVADDGNVPACRAGNGGSSPPPDSPPKEVEELINNNKKKFVSSPEGEEED